MARGLGVPLTTGKYMHTIAHNDGQIITRDLIEAKACKAFFAGLPRTAHEMNWNAAALPTWLAAYDRCAIQYPHLALRTDTRVDAPQPTMEGA